MSEHGSGRDDHWQHLAPIHSWMVPATIVVVLVPLVAVGALMYRGRDSATVPHLTPPLGASDVTLPPPTTAPPSLAGLPLPAVDGTPTTPTVRLQGNAKLGGAVEGPAGPVSGATVHIERIDGGYADDISTGQDGRYLVEGVPGGRYRLRAFRAPTYAQTESVVAFVAADESHTEDLQVDRYDQLAVTAAVAPDPPAMGSPLNLVIWVGKRTVDGDGVVRPTPISGATVTVVTGAVDLAAAALATGADGTATFYASCKAAGPLGVSVQVKVTAADAPQTVALDLPACSPPPTTTTTTTAATSPTTATTAKPN